MTHRRRAFTRRLYFALLAALSLALTLLFAAL